MKPNPVVSFSALIMLVFGAALVFAQAPAEKPPVDPGAPCFSWPAVDYDGDGVFDRVDNCPGTKRGCVVDKYGCAVDSDRDGVCDGLDQCPDTPLGVKVNKEGCSEAQVAAARVPEVTPPPPPPVETPRPAVAAPPPAPPVSETERKLVETGSIRLENVYFETASAKLLPESETTLNEVGSALEKFSQLQIEIQGHTDTRGTAAYNMKLSQARAEAVRTWLLEHFQLKPENYIAKGYGETRPETKERSEEEMLRNRRVMLVVLNPDALPKGVQIEK
jgi:OOP family OmpA-OmpF porin